MLTSHISALPGASSNSSAASGTAGASSVSGAGAPFGSVRQAIMRVVAAQVLGALTQNGGGAHALRKRDDADDAGHHRGAGSAGAVAQALKSAMAQGADPAELLAKVQDGIDQAQASLAGQGADPAQVAAATSEFTDRVAKLMDAPQSSTAPVEDALSASAQVVRKERGMLELRTQDGDVLRIRFRNTERQQVDVASVSGPGGQATAVQLSSSERSRTKIEVEGSLDAGELKAIQDFVGKVDALANEFFDGDVEAAFTAAASLDYDASEIAGYSLKLGMSERVQASAVQTTTTGRGRPQAPAQALPPALPTAPAAQSPLGDGTTAPASAAPQASQPVADVPAAGPSSDPMQSIHDFLQRVMKTADAPLTVSGVKLAWSAKVTLVAEAFTAAAPATSPSSGASLLNDVLDSAAAQGGAEAPQARLAEAA